MESLVEDIKNEEIIYNSSINYISETSQSDLPIQYGKEWSNEIWDENEHNGINWGLEAIHCISAWNILEDNEEKIKPIRLGLIDSGFDINHEDLAFAETFLNMNATNHGTHVAGIMCAVSNNEEGICGVYPFGDKNNPLLYGVSFKGSYDYNTSSCMGDKCAFAELILRNVKVINCSFGLASSLMSIEVYNDNKTKDDIEKMSLILADFFERLLNKGYDFVIVQASGNYSNTAFTKIKCDDNGNIEYDESGNAYYDEQGISIPIYNFNEEYVYIDGDGKNHEIINLVNKNITKSDLMESKYGSLRSAINKENYPDIYNRIIVVGSIGREIDFSKALFDNTITINLGDSGYCISTFSNLGERVDVLAPGENIFSTVFDEEDEQGNKLKYNNKQGTSMSAPYVSGIAAMVWSANNQLSGAEVKEIICSTANNLVNLGEDGSEYNKTEYKLANAKSAVEKALDIEKEGTIEETKNGGILNYVVEKDNEDVKIKDAQVVAVGTDGTEHTTTTDNEGHFELFLPEGTYSLTITKDGYKPYTWEYIEVKNEGVNYLSDWTKLEKIYTWHLSPTIDAEDIIVSDVEKINYYGFNANPFDEYSIVNENGKYRFIKYDGTYISDNQYDQWYFSKPDTITLSSENGEISILGYDDNKIIYQSDAAGWGRQDFYIDNKTKEVYTTEYDSVSKYNESDNIVVQSADITITSSEPNSSTLELNNVGKYGIANSNGPVVDCIYDDACMNIGSNIIALEKNGKWGYFNKDGTQIIDFVCEPFESKILDVMWFHTHNDENIQHPYLNSYGYIPVKINGQCGYYDTQGNEIIPCGTFEEVRPVHNGFAWVKKDGKWGVIQLEDIEQETESTTTDERTNTDVVIDIYEGETITLSGTIFYEHYEINSNNSGDALILELDEPFTAKYCKSEAFEIGSTEKITSVQISSDDMSKFSEGQHITITGTIMNAHTGHHVRSIILLTDDANNNISGQQTSSISDNQILKAVNQYLEENQNHLGVFLSNSNAYCPAEYVASRDTSWSCPINNNNYTYSSGYIAGSYPYYAFADKETMICTISANYETVAEFELSDYIQ